MFCQWRHICLLPAFLLVFASPSSLQAAGEEAPVYRLQAAYLYHFTQFVEWPDEAKRPERDPIRIGVLGRSPFGPSLDLLKTKTVRGRPVSVNVVQTLNDTRGFDILYVSVSEEYRLQELLHALDGKALLTVSEIEDFHQRGGVVRFYREHGKLRFAFNLKLAKSRQLSVSSRLLSVAGEVVQ